MTRCGSIELQLDIIKARINSLARCQANSEATLAILAEILQAVFSAVTLLTEKLDALASRCDELNDRPAPSHKGLRFVTLSSLGFRPLKKHAIR